MIKRVIERQVAPIHQGYDVMSGGGICADLLVNVKESITKDGYNFLLRQVTDSKTTGTEVIIFSEPRKSDQYQRIVVTIHMGDESRKILEKFIAHVSAVIEGSDLIPTGT